MGKLIKKKRGLSRRNFLKHAGLGVAATPLLAACGNSDVLSARSGGSVPALDSPFQHGIASGDPLPERMMFWTRITAAGDNIPVTLKVYADPALSQLITQSAASASSTRDYTVKIDQGGLTAGATYYYQFEALGFKSAIGRTRTAPSGANERLRFGVVSCSSYAHGYFNGYLHLAKRADIDAVLHLGDYIYEYGTGEYGTVRPYQPDHEMIALPDYRTRHAYYKQDPDLMELHRQFPFITTWDYHESTDNSWRDAANNHTEGAEGQWPQRKAWAQQAYDEWMPIRYPESGNVSKIFRKFSYGNLADIFILDTRLYDRDEPDGIPVSATGKQAGRKMLGPEQMQWLLDGLSASTATWKLIGQQVVFHQWQVAGAPQAAGGGQQLNGDSWDGYQAERQQIIDHLRDNGINNAVVLSGDVHSSWVADVTDDPNNPAVYDPATGGSVAVEFVTTSITSPFAIDIPEGQQAFLASNPHIRYTDWDKKGYLLLDLNASRVQGEFWYASGFTTPGGTESLGTAYAAAVDANHLGIAPLTTPSSAPENPPPFAPVQ